MFGFLKRYPPAIETLAKLGVDMHAHWLPGIDDGAKNMGESLNIIRRLVDMGYHKLIATPHVMADLYPNSSTTIREALERVRDVVRQAGIVVELEAAAEYLLDENFMRLLEEGDILTLPGKHVLVEFSFVMPPATPDAIFFAIQSRGYVPVLAHPERYQYFHRSPEEYDKLIDRGVKLQVNLLSLTGYYGKSVQKVALQLIEGNKVAILGTDAHHERHLTELGRLIATGKLSRSIVEHPWNNQALFK